MAEFDGHLRVEAELREGEIAIDRARIRLTEHLRGLPAYGVEYQPVTFLLQRGQPLFEAHFAGARNQGRCRLIIELAGRVGPVLGRSEFPDRLGRGLATQRAAQQLPVGGSGKSLNNGKSVRHLECRQAGEQSSVDVAHDRPVNALGARRNEKCLQCRCAGGFLDSNHRDLGDGVLLDDQPLDLARIDIDRPDDFGVVRAAGVGDPSVVVDADPVTRVQPTLICQQRLRPVPIALGNRRSADPEVTLPPGPAAAPSGATTRIW